MEMIFAGIIAIPLLINIALSAILKMDKLMAFLIALGVVMSGIVILNRIVETGWFGALVIFGSFLLNVIILVGLAGYTLVQIRTKIRG